MPRPSDQQKQERFDQIMEMMEDYAEWSPGDTRIEIDSSCGIIRKFIGYLAYHVHQKDNTLLLQPSDRHAAMLQPGGGVERALVTIEQNDDGEDTAVTRLLAYARERLKALQTVMRKGD